MSIRKDTAYNLLGAVLPMVVTLATVPAYIRIVGDERYGVLAIVWAFLGYFSVFNLGLATATAQRIASLGRSAHEEVASTFWTALAINGALGLLGGLIFWPVSLYFFGNVFRIDAALRVEILPSLFLLSLAVPLATLSCAVGGALTGQAKFFEINIISATSTVLMQIIPLIVAWANGPNLYWLLASIILIRFITVSTYGWRCRVHVTRGLPARISRDEARRLISFGGWVTVSAIVSPLLGTLDRFIIGGTMGAKAVAYYTVPFQIAERSAILPETLCTALFPRLAETCRVERNNLADLAIRSVMAVMTPLMLIALFLIEPFLRLWIGPDFAANAHGTAQILLLGFWISAIARVPNALLLAAGRPDLTAKFQLLELAPYIALLYTGFQIWALPGAALAFALRILVDCVLVTSAAGSMSRIISFLWFPAGLLVVAFAAVMELPAFSTPWQLAAAGLLVLTIGWSWRIAPPNLREPVMLFARRLPAR